MELSCYKSCKLHPGTLQYNDVFGEQHYTINTVGEEEFYAFPEHGSTNKYKVSYRGKWNEGWGRGEKGSPWEDHNKDVFRDKCDCRLIQQCEEFTHCTVARLSPQEPRNGPVKSSPAWELSLSHQLRLKKNTLLSLKGNTRPEQCTLKRHFLPYIIGLMAAPICSRRCV